MGRHKDKTIRVTNKPAAGKPAGLLNLADKPATFGDLISQSAGNIGWLISS